MLKDIKAKGRYTGAELPKTVFHASKEVAKKAYWPPKKRERAVVVGGAEWNG